MHCIFWRYWWIKINCFDSCCVLSNRSFWVLFFHSYSFTFFAFYFTFSFSIKLSSEIIAGEIFCLCLIINFWNYRRSYFWWKVITASCSFRWTTTFIYMKLRFWVTDKMVCKRSLNTGLTGSIVAKTEFKHWIKASRLYTCRSLRFI